MKSKRTNSQISVVKMGWDDASNWDAFVRSSYNGTVFHEMRFLSYHLKTHFDFTFLGFMEKRNRLVGVLPCVVEENQLRSPAGASFGGIALAQISFVKVYDIVRSFLSWAEINDIRKVNFTHAPLIYNLKLAQDLDYVLHYSGFVNYYNQFSSVLDLSWFDVKNPLKNLSSAGRRAVRRSFSEDVQVCESDDLAAFYSILVQNKAKFKVKPAHTPDELYRLRDLYPDFFKLFGVFYDGEMVGGIFTFHCNERVLLTFYIASLETYQHVRPVNRALFEAALWASAQKYQYLDLGVSMNTASDNPMEPAWSLISFKEHIGSRGFLRPSYSWS